MKTISLHIIAALAASLALLPSPVASAQAGDRVAQQQLEVKRASAELNRIEAELQGAKDNLARAEEAYKAGVANLDEVSKARTEVNRLEAERQRLTAGFQREALLLELQARAAAFYRPVDLQLKDATVQQAATALSE